MQEYLSVATQKLREVINAKNLPFGTTQPGRDWCVKALHPAEPLTTLDGIPDPSSAAVVVQNYSQSVTVLNPEPGSSGNWDVELFFFPHPYVLGAVHVLSGTGVSSWSTILNNQILGSSVETKKNSFIATTERYRLAYLGVTGYHNASAISNNGLVAAAQYMCTPAYVSTTKTNGFDLVRLVEYWPDAPRTFE